MADTSMCDLKRSTCNWDYDCEKPRGGACRLKTKSKSKIHEITE